MFATRMQGTVSSPGLRTFFLQIANFSSLAWIKAKSEEVRDSLRKSEEVRESLTVTNGTIAPTVAHLWRSR